MQTLRERHTPDLRVVLISSWSRPDLVLISSLPRAGEFAECTKPGATWDDFLALFKGTKTADGCTHIDTPLLVGVPITVIDLTIFIGEL